MEGYEQMHYCTVALRGMAWHGKVETHLKAFEA